MTGMLDAEALRSLALSLAALLAAARLLGHLARRQGIPPVVGEVAAGIALGPTVLGALLPDVGESLVPVGGADRVVLDGLGFVGLVLLLASTGATLDVGAAFRRVRPSLWLPVMSLVVPLAVGTAIGWSLPESFIGPVGRAESAAFLAVILAVSAVPTIARTLTDLDILQRTVGQLTLASAAFDDLAGWFLLAIITAGLGTNGAGDLLASVITVSGFLALAWIGGRDLVDATLRVSLRMTETVAGPLTTVIVIVFVTVWTSALVGLDPVVGALIAGMLLGSSPALRPRAKVALDEITTAFFGPLFFALVGASLDLSDLSDPTDLIWTAGLLVAAIASKLIGATIGARLSGLPNVIGLAVGSGLSARGGLGIVVAAVALGSGALSPAGNAAVVVVAVLTALTAPFMLARLVRHLPSDIEEDDRLRRAGLLAGSPIVGARRVLLLTRGGAHSRVAARVVDLSLDNSASVTVLLVAQPVQPEGAGHAPPSDTEYAGQTPDEAGNAVAALFGHRRVEVRVLEASDPAAAIVKEAAKGYDLMVVGASGEIQAPTQFGDVLNRVLRGCEIPTLLVRSRTDGEGLVFNRLLTSATGTAATQAAQDVAFALGRMAAATVEVVHVISRSDRILHASWFRNAERQAAPHHLLGEAAARAAQFGIEANTHVRVGSAASEELLDAAQELGSDTVVVATTNRSLVDRPFLGHGIEYLLEHAPQNLVIVAFPSPPEGRES